MDLMLVFPAPLLPISKTWNNNQPSSPSTPGTALPIQTERRKIYYHLYPPAWQHFLVVHGFVEFDQFRMHVRCLSCCQSGSHSEFQTKNSSTFQWLSSYFSSTKTVEINIAGAKRGPKGRSSKGWAGAPRFLEGAYRPSPAARRSGGAL